MIQKAQDSARADQIGLPGNGPSFLSIMKCRAKMNLESDRQSNVPQRAQSVNEPLLARRRMMFFSVSALFAATIGCSESEIVVPVVPPGRKTKLERELEEEKKNESRSRKKSRSHR
jgi:hypothetical protein